MLILPKVCRECEVGIAEISYMLCIVAAAIVTVFEAALAGKTATGREGYYFAGL
jgi:hypothetical protein